MFELKKLLTAMMLPPFNVLILWLLSLFFSLFKCKVFSRLCAFLGIAILYVVSIPYTAQTLKDSLITEDHFFIVRWALFCRAAADLLHPGKQFVQVVIAAVSDIPRQGVIDGVAVVLQLGG